MDDVQKVDLCGWLLGGELLKMSKDGDNGTYVVEEIWREAKEYHGDRVKVEGVVGGEKQQENLMCTIMVDEVVEGWSSWMGGVYLRKLKDTG